MDQIQLDAQRKIDRLESNKIPYLEKIKKLESDYLNAENENTRQAILNYIDSTKKMVDLLDKEINQLKEDFRI